MNLKLSKRDKVFAVAAGVVGAGLGAGAGVLISRKTTPAVEGAGIFEDQPDALDAAAADIADGLPAGETGESVDFS